MSARWLNVVSHTRAGFLAVFQFSMPSMALSLPEKLKEEGKGSWKLLRKGHFLRRKIKVLFPNLSFPQ